MPTKKTSTKNSKVKYDLCLKDIKKSFGDKEVLKGISIKLKKGEHVSIIGANGSGKSTLINIITGLLKRYEGEVQYCGFKSKADFLHQIGVQFQENNWPEKVRVDELTELMFSLNYKKEDHASREDWRIKFMEPWMGELLRTFNLYEHRKKKVKHLSGGQKQLLNIMLAFVSKPRFLILDEITTGLDVRMQERILCFIKRYVNEENVTLIIVSHIVNEIDNLVDKLIIMEEGKFKKPLILKEVQKKYGDTQAFMRSYFGGDE